MLSTNVNTWKGLTTTTDGTLYGCTLGGTVYKYPVGGPWSTVPASSSLDAAIAADSLGNIYAARYGGTLYVKTISASSFTPIVPFAGNANWTGLYVDQYDTLWTLDTSGNIYTRAVSATGFTYHDTAYSGARDITVAPNGDVYVCGPYNVWKQTGGTGSFVSLSTSPGYWMSLSAEPNGDIICAAEPAAGYDSGIWVIYAGTNTFVKLTCASDPLKRWGAVCAIGNCKFYGGQGYSSGYPEYGDGYVHLFGY